MLLAFSLLVSLDCQHFHNFFQVWSASKPNSDDAEQPTHELDVLRGHENDVNYVQFRYFPAHMVPFLDCGFYCRWRT